MKNILTILFLVFTIKTSGQTATIKVVATSHDNQYDKFDQILFTFNGQSFSGADKDSFKIKLEDGFDWGRAVVENDTISFKLKFRPDESYTIKAGCCCAAFILTADSNPNRGTVQVKNKANRDLIVVVAEANRDTIRSKTTSKPLFAYESAMCLFKPASILIAEPEYANEKYQYNSAKNIDYGKLMKERRTLILSRGWFHFLHGEKIEITYEDKNNTLSYQLNGYLTPEEIKAYHTFK